MQAEARIHLTPTLSGLSSPLRPANRITRTLNEAWMDGTSRIDELEQKFTENPRRYFAPLANEYRKAGNPQRAIAICRGHLGQLPGHLSGQIVYGQALFDGGEYDEARTVFENALGMDRENLIALRHLGDLALRSGETVAARQWYEKLLEIDPKDTAAIALVNEIDAASGADTAIEPASAEEPAGESVQNVVETPPGAVPPEPETRHSDEEDKLMAEELGYPVPPPQAFVTETMAELYLAQGFRDRALDVYRQLVALRPDDERLKMRLAEIETSVEAPVVDRREEPPSVESPGTEAGADRSPSIETPTPSAPEVQSPSEEISDGGNATIDSPPGETPSAEPDSIESPAREEPRAEPEGVAAQLSVREFFATLGRRRPGSRPNGSSSNGRSHGSSSGDIFGGQQPDAADERAAAALAGAFSSPAAFQSSSASAGESGRRGKESDEDVASFRAWLDGLTGE